MLKNHRTLIATIKDFGARPCPRCLVSVDQICAVGREDDQKWRKESCRQDNAERRKKVDDARKSLYDDGYAITGDHVDGLLKDESLVPTKVFMSVFACVAGLNAIHTECILGGPLAVWLRVPHDVDR